MASDKAPAIISIHTPSSSLALVHSVTTESLTSLFDKLSRKRNTEFYGKRVGPGWLKYEWCGSVWNLDDDGDYAILQWRQKGSTDPPTVYLKDPLEPLPSESSYRSPSFYLVQAQTLSASVLGKRPDNQPLPAVTKGLKRARDESTSDHGEWHRGWRQLDDDDKWKQFGDYWRKNEITSDSPSITLAYEERGEEDQKYRLPLAPETEDRIIVRECYKSLYDYIWYLRRNGNRGLVLTGQPGTGKTLWLSYALVRLLTENETVVYHSGGGTSLFFGNSVYSRIPGVNTKLPPAGRPTFCLIDSDETKDPVDINFMTSRLDIKNTFPVMASSMPGRYDSWVKQRTRIPIEYMPLWESDELKKGLEMQTIYNDLRQDVETMIRSRSVDGSSTIAVSPKNLIRGDWHNLIYSALEMIEGDSYVDDATGDDVMDDAKTGDDAMNDTTGNVATDNATVEVDEVLDKIVDKTIQAYGSSARDVYAAIVTPHLVDKRITHALKGQNYDTLRDAVCVFTRSRLALPFRTPSSQ